jgi:hypothetical protein
MLVINNNELFTQVAAEESSIASGGGLLTAAAYNNIATLFGVPVGQIRNTSILFLINALTVPNLDQL